MSEERKKNMGINQISLLLNMHQSSAFMLFL